MIWNKEQIDGNLAPEERDANLAGPRYTRRAIEDMRVALAKELEQQDSAQAVLRMNGRSQMESTELSAGRRYETRELQPAEAS